MRRLLIGIAMLAVAGFGATLLTQNFDASWSPSSPPTGWRIFATNPSDGGLDDWHQEPANTAPWVSHPTPFAAIQLDLLHPDSPPDSLISPAIDCSGYENVALVCSTYFLRWSGSPYTAQLRYSIDNGATFPYILHDYYVSSSSGPVQETLSLPNAQNQSNVRLAWVFDGDIGLISCWYLDDVSVIADSIPPTPAWDVACWRINSPPTQMPPGNVSPIARFKNLGLNDQYNVVIGCSLYAHPNIPLVSWFDTIPYLPAGGTEKDTFFNPDTALGLGRYLIRFWSQADSDYVRSNDTLQRWFNVTTLRGIRYDDGTAVDYRNWPVGHYGWGVKFTPDTFPVYIESLRVYLNAPTNPAQCRYQLAIFKDSSGQPGEMYYETPVQTATPGSAGWNWVYLGALGRQLLCDSSGFLGNQSFYVFYLQVGEPPECPSLGIDAAQSSGAQYYEYRNGTVVPVNPGGDFMIRATVNFAPVSLLLHDVRTLYVDQPEYDFIQRPFNQPFTPTARIENFGQNPMGFQAICSIIGASGALHQTSTDPLVLLQPMTDTLLTFADFTPTVAERCSVIVRTNNVFFPDDNPLNDDQRFTCDVVKGAHTGLSPLQYGWIDSDTTGGPSYSWVDSSSLYIAPNLDDDDQINIPMYFNFQYYDSTYDYVYASANGWFAMGPFNPGGRESMPVVLPSTSVPNRAIYPYWDNLGMGSRFGHGKLFYGTLGDPPNRRFVLLWQNVNRVGTDTSNGISFEAILGENGSITFQYQDVDCGDLEYDNGRRACIGLEDGNGIDGLTYLYAIPPMSSAVNDPGNRLRSGRAIRLSKWQPDAAALAIVTPGSYCFPGPANPRVKVQNYGSVSDSIRVFLTIGSSYGQDTLLTGLRAGDSTTVTFSLPWNAVIGTYVATCSTHMRNDVNPRNNATSAIITVSPWVQRTDIPSGWRRRKVQSAALCYADMTNKLYAMKGSPTNEFWSYDIATGSWDTLAPMPLAPSTYRAKDGCALTYDNSFGTKGRIWAIKGGGRADFYFYDVGADSWHTEPLAVPLVDSSHIGSSYRPPKRGAALAFAVDVGSAGTVYCLPANNTRFFWRFDVAGSRWYYDKDVPVDLMHPVNCKWGSDLAYYNGKAYLLKGSNTVEMYYFTPSLDSWAQVRNYNEMLGPTQKTVKNGGCMTAFNNSLYILKGGNTLEFWRYDLGADSCMRMTDIPIAKTGHHTKVRRGAHMAPVDTTLFCLKGSYGFEFWEYKPTGDTLYHLDALTRAAREGVMADAGRLNDARPYVAAYPNPTSAGLVIACNITAPAFTRVRIYDAAGKLVTDLLSAPQPAGRHVLHWSGLAADNRRVPSGVYFVAMESGGVKLTQKFVVEN